MEICKRLSYTLEDYIAFNFFYLKKRLIWMPVLLVVLFPAMMAGVSLINGDSSWFVMLIVTGLIGILMAGLMTLVNVLAVRSAAKKQYRSSKAMQSESELIMDEAGVRESSEYGSTVVRWEDVLDIRESATAYYVFFSRIQALLIPKRSLSPAEEDTLRALCAHHLQPAKLRLRDRK